MAAGEAAWRGLSLNRFVSSVKQRSLPFLPNTVHLLRSLVFPERFFLASTNQLCNLAAVFTQAHGSGCFSDYLFDVPVTTLCIVCHCFPTLATQFLYLYKCNEAALERKKLNPEISEGKLQNVEGKESVPGLESLYIIFYFP